MYQRLEFGPDAKTFVRLQLSHGPTLAAILCRLPLELGRVISFLPPHPTNAALLQFTWPINGLQDSLSGNIDSEYRERECGALAKFAMHHGRSVLFYLASLPPGREGKFEFPEGKVCRYDWIHKYVDSEPIKTTEVYLAIPSSIVSEAAITSCLDNARGTFRLIGVIGQFSARLPEPEAPGILTKDDLEQIAAKTEVILVEAYDRDAILIWSRTELPG